MTYRPLQPGDLGIDYSGAHPAPATTVTNGGRFILRYSAGVGNSQPSTAWKLCGPHEIAHAVAAGLDFIANSEWYATRITEGKTAGAADGHADLAFWQSRGLARGATIYVSWDSDPSRAKWRKVDAYLAAYGNALNGFYRVDCYAGTKYLRHALRKKLIRYGWRPNAGSWSGDGLPYQPSKQQIADLLLGKAQSATPAHIWQTGNYWYGKTADENVILRAPVGSHLEAVHATDPAPTPIPPANYDMGPLLEAIMTLDRTSPEYQALLHDIADAVAKEQIQVAKGKRWSIRTTLGSIWANAHKAATK